MKMCWSLRAEICGVSINLGWKDGVIFLAQTCGVGHGAGFWYYRRANGERNHERGVCCVWQCREADCKMTAEVNRLLRIHRAG